MSAVIGSLRVDLGLDSAQFETRAQAAGRAAAGMADGMSRSMTKAQKAAEGQLRTFDKLRASVDPAFAAAQRYAAIQRDVAAMVDVGTVSQRAANLVLEQAAQKFMGVETSAQTAARAQREMAAAADEAARAQRASEAAVDAATRGYRSLLASVNPLYAASRQYEAAQEAVNAAVRQGIITQDEANRTLDQAAKKYLAADAAADLLGNATVAVGAGARNLAPQVQNAAFQIGDMAVQVAGGTSAMRAMSMQLPQLLGGFGLWGAIIGGGVAVLSALAPALLASGDAAKTASDAVDDLTSASDRYRQSLEDISAPMDEITAKYGSMAAEAKLALEDLARLNMAEAMIAARDAITAVNGELLETREFASSAFLGASENARMLVDTFGLANDKAVRLQDALVALEKADSLKSQAAAAQEVRRALDAAYGSADKMPAPLREAYRQMTNIGKSTSFVQSGLDGSALSASEVQAQSDAAANALRNAEAAARALASAMAAAAGYSANLDDGVVVLEAKINALKNKQDANNAGVIAGMRLRAAATRDAVLAEGGLNVVAQARYGTDMAVIDQQEKQLAQIEALTAANAAAASAGKSAASAGKSAANAAEKEAKQLDKEAEAWRDIIDPMNKYRRQHAELDTLLQAGKLTSGEVQQALAGINQEIADADPLLKEYAGAVDSAVDYMLSGFKDGFKGLFDIAKDTLKNIIAMFVKNKIMLSFGGAGAVGGIAGTAAAAAGAVPGAAPAGCVGSLGILGSLGGIGSAFMSGMGLSGSAFMSGGIGSMFSAIGTQAGTALATGTMTSIAATVGAIALPVAAIAAAFSFFSTKTKLLDEGIKVTVDNLDTLVYSFKKVEKSKFWGLSKSTSTSWDVSGSDLSDPIVKIVHDLQMGVLDAASALDVGKAAFKDFAASIEFSTKDMSDDEIMSTLQEKILELGDSFAHLAFGNLSYLIKEGEGATAALSRLVASMQTANGIMDTLGHSFRAAGLAGAGMAAELADLFGGLDAMTSATSAYYQAFYTEQERNATATRQAAAALKELGVAMPRTRDQYRAMIEAMDLTTDAGRQAYAALVGMSGVFDQILPQLGSFTAKIATMVETLTLDIDKMIGNLSDLQKQSFDAAKAWYNTARTLREFVSKMRGVASALISPGQARANNESRYQILLARAAAGDAEAAGQLTGAADALIESAKATAGSALDVARVQARVLADIGNVANVADVEGKRHEIVAGLFGSQVDVLKKIRDLINSGLPLDPAELKKLTDQLGALSAETVRAMGGSVSLPMLEIKDAFKALPLGDLRSSLVDLRKAVLAETARANAEKSKQAAIDKAQAMLSRVAADQQKAAERVKNAVGAVNTFDSNVGGNLVGKDGNAVQAYVDANGKAVLNATGVKGASGESLDLWRSTFWKNGGLEDQMYAANKAVNDANKALEEARKAVRQAGGIPAFAGGGYTGDGARSGGLDGQGGFMAMLHPQETVVDHRAPGQSASTSRDAEMIAELRALRAEVARMRNENTQLALRTEKNTYDAATVLRREERRMMAGS